MKTIRQALIALVEAEEAFERNGAGCGIKLDDPVSDAVKEARTALAAPPPPLTELETELVAVLKSFVEAHEKYTDDPSAFDDIAELGLAQDVEDGKDLLKKAGVA